MSAVINVSDASFEADVLKSEFTVLLDFWAEWCRPCQALGPVLDEIAQDYKDKVSVCKLNIDDNEETPANLGVRGIPTLMIYKQGELVAIRHGASSKGEVAQFIDENT